MNQVLMLQILSAPVHILLLHGENDSNEDSDDKNDNKNYDIIVDFTKKQIELCIELLGRL